MTSWFSFVPHPERYIIHRKFGFTQLMREKLNSPPNAPCSAAYRPMAAEYAWYTMTVSSSNWARMWRPAFGHRPTCSRYGSVTSSTGTPSRVPRDSGL